MQILGQFWVQINSRTKKRLLTGELSSLSARSGFSAYTLEGLPLLIGLSEKEIQQLILPVLFYGERDLFGNDTWESGYMPIFRIFITALIVLSNASVAMAEIYKCDGPDGPIYSDQKCSPSATTVDVSESAGLSGVSDEELSELAEKKSDRDQARNRNTESTVIENQSTTDLTTYNNDHRVPERDQLEHRIDSDVSDKIPQQPRKKKHNRRY